MISVKNLSKTFGQKLAVDSVSFEVKKGEVLGFLGPNGAGKSTTMRMVTGYLPPTEGEVEIDGINVVDNPIQAKQKIGYLPESAPLYSDMTVSAFLSFTAEIRGKKSIDVEAAIETCFLGPVKNQNIDTSTIVGELFFNIINSISQYERDLTAERIKSGLENAKRKGKTLGRKSNLNIETQKIILNMKSQGIGLKKIAKETKVSVQTIRKLLSADDSMSLQQVA